MVMIRLLRMRCGLYFPCFFIIKNSFQKPCDEIGEVQLSVAESRLCTCDDQIIENI